jgi:plastocyanin
MLAATANAFDQVVHVIDAAGRPLADAVIYAIPDAPLRAKPHTTAVIDQIKKQFAPRISVVQTGTEIAFPNSDNIRHSVYSFSPPKPFTLKLYAGQPSSPLLMDNPGVVVLGCNIHDRMAAWLVVVDTPYFGRSNASGTVTLRDLPAGHYRLVAWYPTLADEGESRDLTVGGGAGRPEEFSLKVKPIDEQGL